jgi:TRAP-type C4-dicarboxylate transport system permease small subunit
LADASEDRTDDTPRSRPLDILFRGATEGLSALVLFALMVMTCIDVFGREVLNAPLDGATELTQLMLGVIVFAVLPVVSYRGDHVAVDLLDRWFPARLAKPRQVVLNLLMAGMMAAVCWRVWIIGALQADYGDATEFLRIPLGPISMFISVTSGIAAVAMLANAVRIALGRPDPIGDNTQIS